MSGAMANWKKASDRRFEMHNADDLREKRMKNMDVKKIIVSFCPYVTPCIKDVRYETS